jgi:C-terminal processing protease CtpA/Prc
MVQLRMFSKRFLLATLIAIILVSVAFTAGFFTRDRLQASGSHFPVLDQAYEILTNHSLKEIPESPLLEYGMIRGMLQASGDPYALFLEPAIHELETNSLEGNFGGIGIKRSGTTAIYCSILFQIAQPLRLESWGIFFRLSMIIHNT